MINLSRIPCLLGLHAVDHAAVHRRARRMARMGVDVRRVGCSGICTTCGKRVAVRL